MRGHKYVELAIHFANNHNLDDWRGCLQEWVSSRTKALCYCCIIAILMLLPYCILAAKLYFLHKSDWNITIILNIIHLNSQKRITCIYTFRFFFFFARKSSYVLTIIQSFWSSPLDWNLLKAWGWVHPIVLLPGHPKITYFQDVAFTYQAVPCSQVSKLEKEINTHIFTGLKVFWSHLNWLGPSAKMIVPLRGLFTKV